VLWWASGCANKRGELQFGVQGKVDNRNTSERGHRESWI